MDHSSVAIGIPAVISVFEEPLQGTVSGSEVGAVEVQV